MVIDEEFYLLIFQRYFKKVHTTDELQSYKIKTVNTRYFFPTRDTYTR